MNTNKIIDGSECGVVPGNLYRAKKLKDWASLDVWDVAEGKVQSACVLKPGKDVFTVINVVEGLPGGTDKRHWVEVIVTGHEGTIGFISYEAVKYGQIGLEPYTPEMAAADHAKAQRRAAAAEAKQRKMTVAASGV